MLWISIGCFSNKTLNMVGFPFEFPENKQSKEGVRKPFSAVEDRIGPEISVPRQSP